MEKKFWKYFVLRYSNHCISHFPKTNATTVRGLSSQMAVRFWRVKGYSTASVGLRQWHRTCKNPLVPSFLGPPELPHAQLHSNAWEPWLWPRAELSICHCQATPSLQYCLKSSSLQLINVSRFRNNSMKCICFYIHPLINYQFLIS